MSRVSVSLIATSLAMAMTLAACKREQPAPSDVPETPPATSATQRAPAEPAKIPGTDAIAVSENTAAQAGVQQADASVAGVDSRTFAGSFATEGALLHLGADGTYRMVVQAESAGADLESTGTWTIEADGKQILLDSDAKSEADRRYALAAPDELRLEGGDQVLRRNATR